MKKSLSIALLAFFATSGAFAQAGLRTFGTPNKGEGGFIYIAIRGGFAYFMNSPSNEINRMQVYYDEVWRCGEGTSSALDCATTPGAQRVFYGPRYQNPPGTDDNAPAEGELISLNPSIANFHDWEIGEDLKTYVGYFSFAFGGRVKQDSNIRIEVEAAQYLNLKYKSSPFLKGYMQDASDGAYEANIDNNLTTAVESDINSSTFMFNVIYDFNKKGETAKKGDFIPFVGVGVGIAINQTKTTLLDPEGEMSDPSGGSFFKYSSCASTGEWNSSCYYPEYTKIETSFAWNIIAGTSYVLGQTSSIEMGVKFTNLGLVTWGIGNNEISEDLIGTNNMFNTSIFVGYRRNF